MPAVTFVAVISSLSGVHSDIALIAIKATGGGLVAVAGVGVDGRYDPVLRDALRDPKHAVLAFVEILTDDRGQQRRRLRHAS